MSTSSESAAPPPPPTYYVDDKFENVISHLESSGWVRSASAGHSVDLIWTNLVSEQIYELSMYCTKLDQKPFPLYASSLGKVGLFSDISFESGESF